MAAAITKWPTFERYVADIIEQVRSHVESLGASAHNVQEKRPGCTGFDLNDCRFTQTYLSKSFRIAESRKVRNMFGLDEQQFFWVDETNVCSDHRLCILLA